ncbi:uncharacterized protein LOC107883082 [Acyrthosiphon pisum]|uniref:MD-2-related lipid-recognition domain-containing protein n=1 Tax=Acyrthosiphon pisum TaxID=7029 RepID=A0A8R2D2B0_ACYPI|nr:uncharacterized protein LOC107883082 [Acyrthosiphon pisum]|eukprot:XP_016657970.1 PREDICTED: uncharacterized protein LOC107883082 [Acyrthosiphon pisum]
MKLSVIFVLILVSRIKPERTNNKPRLKLPIGEYRIDIKKIYSCNTTRQNDIHANYYLNKTSDNSKEIKGNLSLLMPFDDNLSMDINFSVRGADGDWKNNTYIFHAEQAFTKTKNLMSKIDTSGLGFNLKHPVPVGFYVATGFNVSNLDNLNYIPKEFAYGLYKIRYILTDKKHQHFGCFVTIIQLKRPSEII